MKTFRELCNNKPSVAIQAMVDGLRNQDKRSDFQIRMNSFGHSFEGIPICYGCAEFNDDLLLAQLNNFNETVIRTIKLTES